MDDVGFLSSLAQYLQAEYSLSPYNTFSIGMSNGGKMSYMLACQANDIFKAIASVAGMIMEEIYNTCESISIPVFEIHGTQDDINWWDGDPNNIGGWGSYIGVLQVIDF